MSLYQRNQAEVSQLNDTANNITSGLSNLNESK